MGDVMTAVTQLDVLRWLDQAQRSVAKAGGLHVRVGLHDVDVWDAAINHTFMAALSACRGDAVVVGSSLEHRARSHLYQLRQMARARAQPAPPTANVVGVICNSTHIGPVMAVMTNVAARGLRGHAWLPAGAGYARDARLAHVTQSDPMRHALAIGAGPMVDSATHELRQLPSLGTASAAQLQSTIRHALHSSWLEVVATARAVEDAVERGLQAFVVGNDISLQGRACVLAARALGIPTVSPMHGLVAGEPLQGRHVASRVLVWGELARAQLVSLGEETARIAVVGLVGVSAHQAASSLEPRIDAWLQQPSQACVLVATSGPGHALSVEQHRGILRILHDAVSGMDAPPMVVVKLHPKDQRSHYDAVTTGVAACWKLSADAPRDVPGGFDAWMGGMAAVITTTSTAGVDAMQAGVPVIAIDPYDHGSDVDFIREGGVHRATNAAQLRALLGRVVARTLMPAAGAPAYLARAFAASGETAAAAAGDVVIDLLRGVR
jgi:hypothetical protein